MGGKRFVESEIIGERNNNTTVLSFAGFSKNGVRKVNYRCDCGVVKIADLVNLRRGQVKSCGCYGKEYRKEAKLTHGMSKTPLQKVWSNMKSRCYNKNVHGYADYGGRGIKICQEWLDNNCLFFEWAIENGWKDGLCIDRENNDKDYSPDNCHFVTRDVNNNNRRTRSDNKTGFKGVHYDGCNYIASVYFRGNKRHCKYGFKTAEEAAKYRDRYILENCLINQLNL